MSDILVSAAFAFTVSTLLVPRGSVLLGDCLIWCGLRLRRHGESLLAGYRAYKLTWRGDGTI